jgi:hypothetical protein
MGSFGQKTLPTKNKTHKEDPLTIMIMRGAGKMRSFKIAPLFLYIVAIFILLNIIATIYFGNRFFDLRPTSAMQSKKIKQLEAEASKNQKTIHRNKQHMAILEEYIRNLETPREGKTSTNKSIFLKQKSTEPDPPNLTDPGRPEATSSQVIDIQDVAIKKEGSELTVNFKVVNLREFDNPIGGYIHMIAVGKDGYSPRVWTFPNEDLRDGVPVDFRRGQLFLIQRFKPIKGNFFLSTQADPPSAIKVLVYNQTGTLLIEKEFKVSDGS